MDAVDAEEGLIDPEMLERMARIARVLPGRVVSLEPRSAPRDRESAPVVCIDGVAANEIAARYERDD